MATKDDTKNSTPPPDHDQDAKLQQMASDPITLENLEEKFAVEANQQETKEGEQPKKRTPAGDARIKAILESAKAQARAALQGTSSGLTPEQILKDAKDQINALNPSALEPPATSAPNTGDLTQLSPEQRAQVAAMQGAQTAAGQRAVFGNQAGAPGQPAHPSATEHAGSRVTKTHQAGTK